MDLDEVVARATGQASHTAVLSEDGGLHDGTHCARIAFHVRHVDHMLQPGDEDKISETDPYRSTASSLNS